MKPGLLPVKQVLLLLCLSVNNAVYSILVHQGSKTKPQYTPSFIVLFSELLKLVTSLLIYACDKREQWGQLFNLHLFVLIAPPSIIYTVQNNLLFVGLANLDAATYQVSCQIKILTTAAFMVVLLGKHLIIRQWIAIFLLFVGVAIVQLAQISDDKTKHNLNYTLGLSSVIVCSLCSGFAGVYFEKVLKNLPNQFWVLNIHMYIWGIICNFVVIVTNPNEHLFSRDKFSFDALVLIVLSTVGGFLACFIIHHLNNVWKSFAAAGSIILAAVGSMALGQHDQLDSTFWSGVGLVCLALYLYC